uniref:Uncharacterized protein n=1 Tax=Anopheles quadriannulatus TaxID=34691 RepID=A0A182X9V6_ANOQN
MRRGNANARAATRSVSMVMMMVVMVVVDSHSRFYHISPVTPLVLPSRWRNAAADGTGSGDGGGNGRLVVVVGHTLHYTRSLRLLATSDAPRAQDTRLVGLVLTVVVLVVMVSTLVAAAIRATAAIGVGGGSGSTGGTKSVQILTAGGPWLSIGEVSWPQLELISLRFAHRRTDHYDQHDEHG